MKRNSRSILLLGLAVAATGVLAGCPADQVHFYDDVDLTFDFKPFDPLHPPSDELHQPYVAGTEFRMWAHRDHDKMDLTDSYADSEDPGVLDVWDSVADDDSVGFKCRAVSEGTTWVVVHRREGSTRTWGRALVEVVQPAKAQVTFAGPLFIGADRDEYRVGGSVNVLVGGTATFLVEYEDRQGRHLNGNGVLEVGDPGDGIDAYADQTYLFEDREWLVVTPTMPGDHVVTLSVAGHVIGTVTVRAVQPEDVAFIELRPESEKGHSNGDWVAVLALGYTDSGDPIYGIEFDWEVNGWPKPGEGDLYRYELDRRDRSTLLAEYRGKTQSTDIHSDYEDGYVDSTNNIGCTASATGGGAAGLLLVLLPLGLLLARRRPVSLQD